MATIEDLRLWISKDVLDQSGEKVGKLADVYFDVDTDAPSFLVIDTGRRKPSPLVPAWNAMTSPDHVVVPYDMATLDTAPALDPVVGLTVEDESALFDFYRVQYTPSHSASGRRLMRR